MPTRLWGFSGHMQTILHSIVGRVRCPWPLGERVYLTLADGSTLTFDLYQPLNEHEGKRFMIWVFDVYINRAGNNILMWTISKYIKITFRWLFVYN